MVVRCSYRAKIIVFYYVYFCFVLFLVQCISSSVCQLTFLKLPTWCIFSPALLCLISYSCP